MDSESGTDTWQFSKTIKLDSSGNDTSEWTKTYVDIAGRTRKTLYSDNSYALSFYNAKGQMDRSIDPDKVVSLSLYDGEGVQEYTGPPFLSS